MDESIVVTEEQLIFMECTLSALKLADTIIGCYELEKRLEGIRTNPEALAEADKLSNVRTRVFKHLTEIYTGMIDEAQNYIQPAGEASSLS